MSTHKHIDKICCAVLAFTLVLSILFVNAGRFGVQRASAAMGYENTLFDASRVHTIDIVMDDWDGFLETCRAEEYSPCTLVIDNEPYANAGIRGKGNTSLTQVEAYGNDRYSFKVEFDHYDSGRTYYGLDKLCLNNAIQDNTYMKDYLSYQLMHELGAAAPLCSYVWITVNGEAWGLYLAVEGVEDGFLQRSFGRDHGELYKPDSMSMGQGNGEAGLKPGAPLRERDGENADAGPALAPKGDAQAQGPGNMPGGGGGSDDVLLKYIDDDAESYPNIFNNAKTAVTNADKARLIAALKRLSAGGDLEGTVYVDAVIRYFAAHNFVLNFDSYTGSMVHNYYLYEKDGCLQMIPWDYNLAFGGFSSMDTAESLINYPIDSPVSGGSKEDRPMLAWIWESEEYTRLYHQYFSQLISGFFESGRFEEMMDQTTGMIAPYVEKDPTRFCTYEEFEAGAATLKEFCLLRAESIRGQLEGSIGSEAETQRAGTLVDPGDIQISTMGSMENAMGGGSRPQLQGSLPDGEDTAAQPVPPQGEGGQAPAAGQSSSVTGEGDGAGAQPPGGQPGEAPPDFAADGSGGGGGGGIGQNGFAENAQPDRKGQPGPQAQTASSAGSWALLGASGLVLGLGLLFALAYPRRI